LLKQSNTLLMNIGRFLSRIIVSCDKEGRKKKTSKVYSKKYLISW